MVYGWVEDLHTDRTNIFTSMEAEGDSRNPVKLA